jgi:hypothetical protein
MMSELAKSCYRRYERNLALADVLEKQPSIDDDGWGIVVRFYAALHLISSYLIDKGTVSFRLNDIDHERRKIAMAKCPEFRDAPGKYRALKELSEEIRYNPEFEIAAHHRDQAKKLLAKIIAIVDPKIKKQ